MSNGDIVDVRKLKIAAVLNTASGSCTDESAPEMEGILAEFGITLAHMWCGASDELPRAFEQVAASNIEVLIVLGGDGTIRSAAESCTPAGPFLVPLPGGTMNVLPKALYGNLSWQDILRSVLQQPRIKSISGGEIGANRFFISAICGAPALWANVREALRERDLGVAMEQGKIAVDHLFASKIQYSFDEMHEGSAEALTVTCPLISNALEDDRQVFEAAVIDLKDIGEMLGLATAAAFGKWREAKNVAIVRTASVTITAEHDIPIILDGETIDAGHEVRIDFIDNAFNALIPRDEILS